MHHWARHQWLHDTSASSVSWVLPVPSCLRHKIRRGEYVDFAKLLLPMHTPPLFQPLLKPKQTQEAKHTLTDLGTWLEAWNHFLYHIHPAQVWRWQNTRPYWLCSSPTTRRQNCLEYDHLLCQAAVADPSLCWDTIKNNIYIWAITKKGQSFQDRPSIMSQLCPPASDTSNHQ